MTTQSRMDRDGKSRRNADIPLSKTIRYYSIRFHLTRFNPGLNRWYKTLEWGILNVVSETIDSIAFRYPTWHSFFPPSLLLSFQRLEIKWKIDMEIKWNWDYWNLQRSGWIIIIIISDILFVFSTFFFFFNYREWFNQLHHMEYI